MNNSQNINFLILNTTLIFILNSKQLFIRIIGINPYYKIASIILMLISFMMLAVYSQDSVLISGNSNVCPGNPYMYELVCNCDCRLNYIDNVFWTVKNGSIIGEYKNVMSVFVVWDNNSLNKSVKVKLLDNVDPSCICNYKLEMNVTTISYPILDSPQINKTQICPNDSLAISTSITNNPEGHKPIYEYCLSTDDQTWFPINKPPSNEIHITKNDIHIDHLNKNINLRAYVNTCVTEKTNSPLSASIRFFTSSIIDTFHANITPPTCYNGNDGQITINSMFIGDTLYNASNPYKDTIYLLQVGENPIPIQNFSFTLENFSAGKDSLTFQLKDGRCINEFMVDIPETPAIRINPIPSSKIAFNNQEYHISCKNDSSGAVNVMPEFINPPYNISLFKSQDSIGGYTDITDMEYEVKKLKAGKYKIVITDANGCFATDSFKLIEPSEALSFDLVPKNTLCYSDSTGEINLLINSGYPNFQTSISKKGEIDSLKFHLKNTSHHIFKGLDSSHYVISLTDTLGCIIEDSIIVSHPLPIRASLNEITPDCLGQKGSLSIVASGGSGDFNFQINDTSQYVSEQTYHLMPGLYVINIKDKNNCIFSIEGEVPGIADTLKFTHEKIPPSCAKNSDGLLKLYAEGGNGTYNFINHVNGSKKTGDSVYFDGLCQNKSYNIELQDSKCSYFENIIIPPNPDTIRISSFELINPSCNGSEDGQIHIEIANGYPDYHLFINSQHINDTVRLISDFYDINNLLTGEYEIKVSDKKDCEFLQKASLLEPEPLVADWQTNKVSCYGAHDGSIKVNIHGGNGGYKYYWQNTFGDTVSLKQTASGLSSGDYELLVKDSKNCNQYFKQTLEYGPKLMVEQLDIKHSTCVNANDGNIYIKFNDLFDVYNYELIGINNSINVKNEHSSSSFYHGKMPAGNYLLRTLAGNCDTIIRFEIQAGMFTISIDSLRNLQCYGNNNGYIKLNAFNTINKTKNPFFSLYGLDNQFYYDGPTNEFHDLKAGLYAAYLHDYNDHCYSDTLSFEITQPPSIKITSEITDSALCQKGLGQISLNTTGGIPPYVTNIYQKGNGFLFPKQSMAISPGNYFIEVMDNHGCEKVDTFIMPIATKPKILIEKLRDYTCEKYPALIETKITGDHKYHGFFNNNDQGIISDGDTLIIDQIGWNELIFMSNDGCKTDTTIHFSLVNQVNVEKIIQPPSCDLSNGGITLNVNGGIPFKQSKPYSYSWDHTPKDTNLLNFLGSGTYFVEITDKTGCNYPVEIILNDENGPEIETVITSPTYCQLPLGQAAVKVNGGHQPYEYKWYNDKLKPLPFSSNVVDSLYHGHYIVEIIDSKDCRVYSNLTISSDTSLYVNYKRELLDSSLCGTPTGSAYVSFNNHNIEILWESGSSENTSSFLPGNSFETFYLTDTNKCVISDSIFIPEKRGPVLRLNDIQHEYCNLSNGSINIRSEFGSEPIHYHWNLKNNSIGSLAKELPEGKYWVFAEDKYGCFSDTGFIKLENHPPFLTSVLSITPTSCSYSNDGKIILKTENHRGTVTYLWDSQQINEKNTNETLSDGNHFVIIEDEWGCRDSINFFVPSSKKLKTEYYRLSSPSCYRYSDGEIEVWPEGGTGAYQYQWDNGSNRRIIKNLNAGKYRLIINDTNGCKDTSFFELNEPDSLTILGIQKKYTLCEGQEIQLSPINQWDEYFWHNEASHQIDTNRNFMISKEGSYKLITKNSNGCSASFKFEAMVQNDLLDAEFLISSDAIVGDTITLIDITWPESDNIKWKLPEEILMHNNNGHMCEIIPTKPGIFDIEMTVTKAGCEDTQIKQIKVLKNTIEKREGQIPVVQPSIQDLIIHPNPNNGIFRVFIRFQNITNFTFEIVSLSDGILHYLEHYSGQKEYDFDVNQSNLQQGVYAIKIMTSYDVYSYLIVKI